MFGWAAREITRVHFEKAEHFLTAQVAFLRQGNPQVAVPPAEAVSQEGREGESAVEAEPTLGTEEDTGQQRDPSDFYLFIHRKHGKESASNLSASETTEQKSAAI